jgi:hypothetical protein
VYPLTDEHIKLGWILADLPVAVLSGTRSKA